MKRRYSGNDKHWGPFTFSKHSNEFWRPLGAMLDSGGREDRDDGCCLKLHAFGYTFICELPQIIQPHRIKHIAQSWDAATVERMGRNWYYETFPNEYGFTVSDGFLQVFLGPQTMDSTTTKNWCKHLPWTQWRFVRKSLYDTEGNHFWTEPTGRQVPGGAAWDEQQRMRDSVPKVVFEFADYDDQRIRAATSIEEWEWRFGEGCFKWLSLLCRPKVRRSLDIAFSAEVGLEKGSWKGGMMGHSIDMLPGELHEAAFRRYCEQEHRSKHGRFRITYVSKVS
jgi:hypothetical protein